MPRRGIRGHLLGMVLSVAVGLRALGAAAPPPRPPESRTPLPDGGFIALTEKAVERRLGDRVLWSLPANQPDRPLLFQDSQGNDLFLYFEVDDQPPADASINQEATRAYFRAVELSNGALRWSHSFFYALKSLPRDSESWPRFPLFSGYRVSFARGPWLDQLDADSGVVLARAMAWERIEGLTPLPDGGIRVELKLSAKPAQWSLVFRDGRFRNPLPAGSDLLCHLEMFRFSLGACSDFGASGKDTSFRSFLDLHRFKRKPLEAAFEAKWKGYDLQVPERALRQAIFEDSLNPYFHLWLAFCLHLQGRSAEAEASFQEALKTSTISWHEPGWMARDCDYLGLTAWADALYEKGAQTYFQVVPAPPETVSMIETLIHLPATRVAGNLFLNGHIARAKELVEIRRRQFPVVENEALFSRLYAPWLREQGEELKAQGEEAWMADAERRGLLGGAPSLIPGWARGMWGWLYAALALLLVSAFRFLGWRRFLGALLVFAAFLACRLALDLGNVVLALLALALAAGVPLFGALRSPGAEGRPFRHLAARLTVSPLAWLYVCLLGALLAEFFMPEWAVYYGLGAKRMLPGPRWFPISGAMGGLWLLLLPLLAWGRRWGTRALSEAGERVEAPSPSVRNLFRGALLATWILASVVAWHLEAGMSRSLLPIPAQFGHPLWSTLLLDASGREAVRDTPDALFAAALHLQLAWEADDPHRDDALRLYRRAAQGPNPDARALNNLGVLEKDPLRAKEWFGKAAAADSLCAPALYNLGRCSGDPAMMERARRLDPWRIGTAERYRPGEFVLASANPLDVSSRQALEPPLARVLRFANPFELMEGGALVQLLHHLG